LGSGPVPTEGYENIDHSSGGEVYPLKHTDVDEIRASHILEHFSHRHTLTILQNWVKALKVGGVMKLAVPNFDWIVDEYKANHDVEVEGFLMGAHADKDDQHRAMFNARKLTEIMKAAGLSDIKPWVSVIQDSAILPVSLNLQGTKAEQIASPEPVGRRMKVHAAMSTPRLGFMDNFFCAFQAFLPLGIQLRKHTGAYWQQSITKCFEECIGEGADILLAMDYDTVFTKEHVSTILRLMEEHPEADAIAPIQSARMRGLPLFTMKDTDGVPKSKVPIETFAPDIVPVSTAHFGLTALRVKSIRDLAKPWFRSTPNDAGRWEDGKVDADIAFWHRWAEAGKTLYLANRVVVGHAELMIRWPDTNFDVMYQLPGEFYRDGAPANVWS